MRGRLRRHRTTDADINITAFMNLMVVLVPFLLITAVFSQISILDLNLPTGTPEQTQPEDEQKKPLVLEVLIYANRMEIVDRQSGPIRILPSGVDGYDYKALTTTLKAIKARFPEITEITLLLDSDIPYDVLVQTMDHVRVTKQDQNGQSELAELFPDIAIGDAPPDTSGSSLLHTDKGATQA
jgi:biopolymer transport protein ExbD